MAIIKPATKLVIPAVAKQRAGIQTRRRNYWIPAFAGMTGGWITVAIFCCHVNKVLNDETDKFSFNKAFQPTQFFTFKPGIR